MKRRLLNVLTRLSLLLSAMALAAITVFPRGIERVVHDGSFGWQDGEGWGVAGIGIYEFHAYQGPVVILALPRAMFNLLLCVGVIALALVLLARKLGNKPAPGHCSHCGYDLRATPEKCPECGHVPAAGVAPH
jgi:hypothetical protein